MITREGGTNSVTEQCHISFWIKCKSTKRISKRNFNKFQVFLVESQIAGQI